MFNGLFHEKTPSKSNTLKAKQHPELPKLAPPTCGHMTRGHQDHLPRTLVKERSARSHPSLQGSDNTSYSEMQPLTTSQPLFSSFPRPTSPSLSHSALFVFHTHVHAAPSSSHHHPLWDSPLVRYLETAGQPRHHHTRNTDWRHQDMTSSGCPQI